MKILVMRTGDALELVLTFWLSPVECDWEVNKNVEDLYNMLMNRE